MSRRQCARCGRDLSNVEFYESDPGAPAVIIGAGGCQINTAVFPKIRKRASSLEVDLCADCSLELDRWLRMEVTP